MWIPWAWALAAFLLAAGGAALTALRSSLLIVGEEGLAGAAAAGKESAPGVASTRRGPRGRGRGGGGAARAGVWVLLFLILLFCLENRSTQGAMPNPRRILRGGGRGS